MNSVTSFATVHLTAYGRFLFCAGRMARMKGEPLEGISAIVLIVFWATGTYCWIVAIANQFRAGKHRKPGEPFRRAISYWSMLYHPERYTEEGVRAADKALRYSFAFVAIVLLAMVVVAVIEAYK
jgi:hypothetical protein